MAVSGKYRTFADANQKLTDMNEVMKKVEVLTFMKGDDYATVVTDGVRHRSFTWKTTAEHPTLQSAIAWLEARGYSIVTDKFKEDW